MNRICKILLIFILFSGCTINKNNLWPKKIEKEEKKIEETFKSSESLILELNPSLKIDVENYKDTVKFNDEIKSVKKFKFSSIDNFQDFEPDLIFYNSDVIFFDNKGSIIKFDNLGKIIWKNNYYTKNEKKAKPKLSFAKTNKILIVGDNLAKYYAIDINNGELLWTKNNNFELTEPFIHHVFKSFWKRELDIESYDIVNNVLKTLGITTNGFKDWSINYGNEELNTVMSKANNNGVFGVPSYFIKDELFWGREQLPMIKARLSGNYSELI